MHVCGAVWLQAFVNTGINLPLHFESNAWSSHREDRVSTPEFVDFDREPGKVSIFLAVEFLSFTSFDFDKLTC